MIVTYLKKRSWKRVAGVVLMVCTAVVEFSADMPRHIVVLAGMTSTVLIGVGVADRKRTRRNAAAAKTKTIG